MTRAMMVAVLLGLGVGAAGGAQAQGTAKVPVQSDLRREEGIERRLDPGPPRVGRNVTPTNASGVAGFDGPPGTVGDSVGSYGALPQGTAGADIR